MRSYVLAIPLLLLVIPSAIMPLARAQENLQYVTLYAHGYGTSATLTALPQSTAQKSADLTNGLDFRLNPVLGQNLQIDGVVTFNLYLRATGPFVGSVTAQIAELTSDGTESLIPASKVGTVIYLNTQTVPITLGVGPVISYEFRAGSSIVLHIGINQTSGSGRPLLLWDDVSSPTSVRLPAVSPATAAISYFGPSSFGSIFEAEANGTQRVEVNATLTDAIGVYRFSAALLELTAENGTIISLPLNPKNATDYSTSYVVAADFNQGRWQVSLKLQDSSGNAYSFAQPFWITQFYPVSIRVLDSDGSTLPNATVTVGVGAQSFWSSLTNATGWGKLMLPSTDIVGTLNLTVSWLGTRSLFPFDVTHPTTMTVQLTVYAVNIRITLLDFPLPLARVTLNQARQVGQNSTGIDGTARFGKLPAGNYTVTVEYLLAVYQTQIHLDQSGMITVPVPFPHRTITGMLSVLVVAFASVVVVRKRRGKLYPTSFNYFNTLTHGGLPEACFTVIAGNSGSGKSVLLNSLAAEHLASGNSIYITNMEYPEKIRESMMRLGVGEAQIQEPNRLIFIDAYSAVGGSASTEEFSVSSHTDLTNLGLNVSKCLQAAGSDADVYMDSLNPLVTVLRIDYLINFLQTVAARVKANDGRFIVTVGTGIDERDMTKLEESADCVIETQLHETGAGQRRRLRIKKVRDKPYDDQWIRFRVEEGKGIVFLTREKTPDHQGTTETAA